MSGTRRFWLLGAAVFLTFFIAYAVVKTTQVRAAFDEWSAQDIGPAPGAAR